jgi:hypothetical protein
MDIELKFPSSTSTPRYPSHHKSEDDMDIIPSTSTFTNTNNRNTKNNYKNTNYTNRGSNYSKGFGKRRPFSSSSSIKLSELVEEIPKINHLKNMSPSDWFERLSGESINDNDVKQTIDVLLKNVNPGMNAFKSILKQLEILERSETGSKDFIQFVRFCREDLDYFLTYDDRIKNICFNSLFGIIFSWFSIVNTLIYTEEEDTIRKLHHFIQQPELVCLFECCGRPIFPAHGCYLDGKCDVCKKSFELKDPGRFELNRISDITRTPINGGTVIRQKYDNLISNNIRDPKPDLLVLARFKNMSNKKGYKVRHTKWSIKTSNYSENKPFQTTITIDEINDSNEVNSINDCMDEISGFLTEYSEITENLTQDGIDLISKIENIIDSLKTVLLNRLNENSNFYSNDYQTKNLIDLRKDRLDSYDLSGRNFLLGILRCMKNSEVNPNSSSSTIVSKYYRSN